MNLNLGKNTYYFDINLPLIDAIQLFVIYILVSHTSSLYIIARNKIKGTISSEIGELVTLTRNLNLCKNSYYFDNSLLFRSLLIYILVSHTSFLYIIARNKINGTIPSEIGELVKLANLNLGKNSYCFDNSLLFHSLLTYIVVSHISSLYICWLQLHHVCCTTGYNKLSRALPIDITKLTQLKNFRLGKYTMAFDP